MIIKRILPLFIICANLTIAQNFFPLKEGNQYQIKDDWWVAGPGGYYDSGTDYYSLTVLSDSSIGGDVFYGISSTGTGGPLVGDCLFRYDSLNQKVFMRIPNDDTTRLAVDFNTPPDSEYISYIRGTPLEFISEGLSFQAVLGDTFIVYSMKHFEQGLSIPKYVYSFSDQIGFSNYNYYWSSGFGGSESTQTVISAIIDSVIFNPLILQIDSLYPIIDRPEDTFPFLLTIPYSSSYYGLIDSFYLSADHFREDSLIQSKEYEISIYSPHINFYLEGLESGDIIKLKATITDTSIYNNVAFYPDSGYALIHVLDPITGIQEENNPNNSSLSQNYPNPFNPATTIEYSIGNSTKVLLKIYNVLGIEVATLVDEIQSSGNFKLTFDADKFNLPSGIYFYKLIADDFTQTRKMILSK